MTRQYPDPRVPYQARFLARQRRSKQVKAPQYYKLVAVLLK